MKRIFLAVAITVICTGAFAQKESDKKTSFNVGPEIGFAVGNFNDTHSVGIGVTIQGEFNIAPAANFTLTTGFLSYAGRSVGLGIKFKAAGIIPLKAGIKYFLSDGFYGAAQIGVGFFTSYSNESAFAYTPMLGYEFSTKSGKVIDAGFKYDGYSKNGGSLGAIGFRLAFRF